MITITKSQFCPLEANKSIETRELINKLVLLMRQAEKIKKQA